MTAMRVMVAPAAAPLDEAALAAGGELFRERIDVRNSGLRVGATPRTTLCGGLGLAWNLEGAR